MPANAYLALTRDLDGLLATLESRDDVLGVRAAQSALLHGGVGGLARYCVGRDYEQTPPNWLAAIDSYLTTEVPDWRSRVKWEMQQGW